jgi:beta-galactosidase GanA
VRPAVELREGNLPAWGVEWRSAQMSGGTVVNLCNYRHDAARLTLVRDGRPVPATDVLTGERIKGALTLKPLEVRLLCLSAGR